MNDKVVGERRILYVKIKFFLNLAYNEISDQGLEKLPKTLTYLNLGGCSSIKLSGNIDLAMLKYMDLSSLSEITDLDLELLRLSRGLPSIVHVYCTVYHEKVSDIFSEIGINLIYGEYSDEMSLFLGYFNCISGDTCIILWPTTFVSSSTRQFSKQLCQWTL